MSLTQSFIDEDVRSSLLSSVSFIFKHFHAANNENKSNLDPNFSTTKPTNGVLIDPKYCDNEKFSDIQFIVESKKIYAHRIVISAHPQFEATLNSSNNIVHINDVNYDVFKVRIKNTFFNLNLQLLGHN